MNTTTSDVSPKFIIAVVAIIAILIGAIWIARPQEGASAVNQSQSATASSALTTVGDPHYDFGTISMAAGKVQRQFTIQNTSAEPVEILKMYTSCMCTEAALSIGGSVRNAGPRRHSYDRDHHQSRRGRSRDSHIRSRGPWPIGCRTDRSRRPHRDEQRHNGINICRDGPAVTCPARIGGES